MQIDTAIGLMRMVRTGDSEIPNLVDTVLHLVERLKAFEMRAGLAEAQLEEERAKVTELTATVKYLCNGMDNLLAA